MVQHFSVFFFFIFLFFFNDTATTEIYTLSLHDALPISLRLVGNEPNLELSVRGVPQLGRSEEHTSELQSRGHLVCRLLLEKKKNYYGEYFAGLLCLFQHVRKSNSIDE